MADLATVRGKSETEVVPCQRRRYAVAQSSGLDQFRLCFFCSSQVLIVWGNPTLWLLLCRAILAFRHYIGTSYGHRHDSPASLFDLTPTGRHRSTNLGAHNTPPSALFITIDEEVMTLIDSIKPFWPLLFTFVLPRAISYFQALKTSVRTRPNPRPLSKKASRSLNIIFISVCVSLWLSFSTNAANNGLSNIFATTKTRLGVPNELLFARLAITRSNGILTSEDDDLRSKLTTMPMREIYLRVGPRSLLSCPFCHQDDPYTFIFHALPTQVLFPHITHLLFLGLVTSKSVSGPVAASFRFRTSCTAIALLAFDVYLTAIHEMPVDTHRPGPFSWYASSATFRPLLFCAVDIALAFIIYATATNRFLLFPFLAAASDAETAGDPEELIEQTKSLLNNTSTNVQMTVMKLRGVNVTQNTIRRHEALKRAEDVYWGTVRDVEGRDGIDQSVYDEEEVQSAVARAFGSGNVDVAGMRREAEGFVREITRGLDDQPSQQQ